MVDGLISLGFLESICCYLVLGTLTRSQLLAEAGFILHCRSLADVRWYKPSEEDGLHNGFIVLISWARLDRSRPQS